MRSTQAKIVMAIWKTFSAVASPSQSATKKGRGVATAAFLFDWFAQRLEVERDATVNIAAREAEWRIT